MLHFKINQYQVEQGPYFSKVQYAFERETFDSIPSLVMYHVGKSIPISIQTGAIIRNPINRELPLSYSGARYASLRRSMKSNESTNSAQSQASSAAVQNRPPPAGQVLIPNNPTPLLSRQADSFTSRRENEGSLSSPQPFPLQLPIADTNISATTQLNFLSPTSGSPKRVSDLPEDQLAPLPTQLNKSSSNVPPKPSRVPSFRRPIIRHNSSKVINARHATEDEKSAQRIPFSNEAK